MPAAIHSNVSPGTLTPGIDDLNIAIIPIATNNGAALA